MLKVIDYFIVGAIEKAFKINDYVRSFPWLHAEIFNNINNMQVGFAISAFHVLQPFQVLKTINLPFIRVFQFHLCNLVRILATGAFSWICANCTFFIKHINKIIGWVEAWNVQNSFFTWTDCQTTHAITNEGLRVNNQRSESQKLLSLFTFRVFFKTQCV